MLKKKIMIFGAALSTKLEDLMKLSKSELGKLENRSTYPRRHGNQKKFQSATKLEYFIQMSNPSSCMGKEHVENSNFKHKSPSFVNKYLKHILKYGC